jgi:Zn finger protein HypA/HybF involved in hydrogenase expression
MSEIGKKVQDAEVIGHEVVDGNKVPILKPEVWEKVYCNNCNNEVDSEELATGDCSDCGNPWASTKTKDVTIRVVKMPDVFGSGGEL